MMHKRTTSEHKQLKNLKIASPLSLDVQTIVDRYFQYHCNNEKTAETEDEYLGIFHIGKSKVPHHRLIPILGFQVNMCDKSIKLSFYSIILVKFDLQFQEIIFTLKLNIT